MPSFMQPRGLWGQITYSSPNELVALLSNTRMEWRKENWLTPKVLLKSSFLLPELEPTARGLVSAVGYDSMDSGTLICIFDSILILRG